MNSTPIYWAAGSLLQGAKSLLLFLVLTTPVWAATEFD
ncbi:MAG: hypothetical protein JWN58_940, partial [Gammaproteobacteria bacterium]|nr:hypothetical protein [Gammaproteobacteria bacterium]